MKGRSPRRLHFSVSLEDKGTRNRAKVSDDGDATSSASHLPREEMKGEGGGGGEMWFHWSQHLRRTKLLCHMIRFPHLIEFQDPLLQEDDITGVSLIYFWLLSLKLRNGSNFLALFALYRHRLVSLVLMASLTIKINNLFSANISFDSKRY